ncbi:MAG: YhgE/Pip domain-containing protein [Methanobrevibacter sp.]|nr:YhgE/Pip domain-containing protein [Methanobrevibacter sp.]
MSGRDINNIIEIMKHDFHSALLNPIVITVLIAIIILPSLYAIINIEACWDPYEKTGNMKFAVANLDNGTTYNNMSINVGNELVNTLKNNTDFNWVFVSESELREGVKNGTYYSGIIIPQNLSENVVSISSEHPKTAILYYIVNDKTNPVAPRIAQQGANAVYKEMNAKIVEFINLAAYSKLGQLQSSLSSGSAKLSSGAVQLSGGAGQIQAGAGQVSSGAGQIQAGASQVSGGAQQVSEGSAKVQQGAAQIQSSIDPSTLPEGKIKQVVVGSLNLANASSQVAGGSGNLAQSSSQLAMGSSQLAQGSLSLAAGASLLSSSASSALYAAAAALGGASSSLAGVTGINESVLGQYFYSPINLEKVNLYQASNYGSQVAPFYLVLSMWVGAVITCVMIRPGISAGTKYSPLEMYFGKLGFYIVMALLQSAVTITLAFIIGIDIDNPIMFIFSCMLVSVVFMILIYSFISALGQVGKGLSILLLVFQISGTGGIYPIEIMDPIFKVLYPFLPMTYAINIIRESALGLLWSNYIPSFLVLLGILVATVIICLLIKDKADEAAHYFESKLEESDLF